MPRERFGGYSIYEIKEMLKSKLEPDEFSMIAGLIIPDMIEKIEEQNQNFNDIEKTANRIIEISKKRPLNDEDRLELQVAVSKQITLSADSKELAVTKRKKY